jgi:hypothetical protein
VIRRLPLLVIVLALALSAPARGQRVDSARVAPKPIAVDTSNRPVPTPPLSPRRAFLYSALLPGYAQSVLGRPTAAAIFGLSEAIAIAMLRESKADLDEARRLRRDSLVVIGIDPASGEQIRTSPGYTDDLIDARRSHVEDWVAFLIANHLFAAADAYVASHLWDLPTQISVRPGVTGTVVSARLHW